MNYLFTFLALVFINLLALGQKTKELNKEYFLDFKNLEHFDNGTDVLELKERVNYELFLKVKEGYNRFIHPSEEEKKKANETKPFQGEKGEYTLNNEYQKFNFSINENGLISGSASLVQIEDEYTYFWNFNFDSGKIKYAELKTETSGNPIRKVEISDSLFVMQYFDIKNGDFAGKRIIKNVKKYDHWIDTRYNNKGIIIWEENKLQMTKKTFYDDGKPQTYINLKTEESIEYDDIGKKIKHSYPTKDKKWCIENYEDGLIIEKRCRTSDNSQQTKYHYKNGQLVNYEIDDFIKDEIRTYDKNNKLLSTRKNSYKQLQEQ